MTLRRVLVWRCVEVILITLVLFLGMSAIGAAEGQRHLYLALVRGREIRVTGAVYPPNGLHCLLQQGVHWEVDPRTDQPVYNCEDSGGHGNITWTGSKLLIDHLADGSGSLTVVDGTLYVSALRRDGGFEVREVPTP